MGSLLGPVTKELLFSENCMCVSNRSQEEFIDHF